MHAVTPRQTANLPSNTGRKQAPAKCQCQRVCSGYSSLGHHEGVLSDGNLLSEASVTTYRWQTAGRKENMYSEFNWHVFFCFVSIFFFTIPYLWNEQSRTRQAYDILSPQCEQHEA